MEVREANAAYLAQLATPCPPGYKQTEVGVIPVDWNLRQLGEVVMFLDGKRRPVKDADRAKMRGIIPYYGASGIVDYVNDYLFDEELILLGEDGENILSRNCRLAFRIKGKTWVNNHAHVLKPNPDVSIGFLTDYLESLNYERFNSGTAQPKLNKQTCFGIPVTLPPTKAEQEAIAEALSDADELIESLEQLITKKRHLKQGAMQELLTGKKRLPGFQVRPGNKQTELGMIPEDWDVKLLPDVCRFRGGKAHEQHVSEFGRYVCVNSKFVSTDGKIRKYSTANFCCANQNDVLMVMSDLPNGRALAKAYLAEQGDLYAVNQRVCALTAYRDNPKFLFYVLNRNPYFLKFDDGVSQTHLLNNVFRACPILLPSNIAEQEAISAILSDMDTELATLGTKLAKARRVKQGMMQELLTGRIRLVKPGTRSEQNVKSIR